METENAKRQWLQHDNTWTAAGISVPRLPAGFYAAELDGFDRLTMTVRTRRNDDLYMFHAGVQPQVLVEIQRFWDAADRYRQLRVEHKRGILLYGPPGCGKSAIFSAVLQAHIASGGVAIDMGHNIGELEDCLIQLLAQEPGCRIALVCEDLDNYCQHRHNESSIGNVLDGQASLGGSVLFLATTNYLDKIPDRLKRRPSRIDTLLYVGVPTAQERFEYLTFLASKFNVSPATIRYWADESADMTLAELKELVIAATIYEQSIPMIRARLKGPYEMENEDDGDDCDDAAIESTAKALERTARADP